MKSLVVGAMLLHSMNAQLVPAAGADTAPVAPVNAFIPSTQPPALDAAPAGIAAAPPQQLAPEAVQPVAIPVQQPQQGQGIFNDFAGPAVAAPPLADPAVAVPLAAAPVANIPPAAAPVDAIAAAGPAPVAVPIAAPVIAPVAAPVASDPNSIIVTPTPLFAGSAVLPIGVNPYVGPYEPNSIYDPNSPYYDPTAQPPGWEGEDNGIYDGEDDNAYRGGKPPVKNPGYDYDDDEECPAWCLPEDDSYPPSTPDYDSSPYEPTATPKYPDYESVAKPYPETTPEYTPYPKEYPTPSPKYAADPYQEEPVTTPYPEYEPTPEYTPYPKEDPTPSPKYAADPYQKEPYPAPTPDYKAEPQYYPEPDQSYPQFKKVRSILRAVRRQVFNWPQTAAYPQPAYSDDEDSSSYDGEDGSIPDWLYDISGAPKKPSLAPKPKPKCPKSCYKPKTSTDGYATKSARPTYTYTRKGGYKTTEEPYQTTSAKDGYYGDETTDAPYADYTSSVWYPQGNSSAPSWPTGPTGVPDMPTSIPDEPTSVPSEPTTLATYYQPQPYPEQTGGGSHPGSPAGDYTGDTLDTICPNTCNPFNPAENFCDITTGCATTGGSKYYCACRAGFRADNYNAKDFSKQFKVAGQPYVYLAVSTSCNTPCSDQTCSEVLERSQCK